MPGRAAQILFERRTDLNAVFENLSTGFGKKLFTSGSEKAEKPKVEIRKKSEGRNPKGSAAPWSPSGSSAGHFPGATSTFHHLPGPTVHLPGDFRGRSKNRSVSGPF